MADKSAKSKKPIRIKSKEILVTTRLSEIESEVLKKFVDRRGVGGGFSDPENLNSGRNMSQVVRIALGRLIESQSIEECVSGSEARLAASIIRTQDELAKVREDCQLLIGIVDQLVRFVLTTTPEVVDRDAAAVTGARRQKGFLDELHKTMTSRGKRARLSFEMDATVGGADE